MTSPDGMNWTQHPLGVPFPYNATYGNGLFVGVGTGGVGTGGIYTSTDAINWWRLNLSIANPVSAIAYGNGLFVIPYGLSNSILTSPDGTNWTLRATGLNTGFYGSINDISFGNGKFISAAADGKSFRSSVDGIHWNQSPPFGTNISGLFQHGGAASVAGGNGLFVAVGQDGVIASSPDGTNWTIDAESGRFGNVRNNPMVQEVPFAPVNARFFRFTALQSTDGRASAAEISVLPADVDH